MKKKSLSLLIAVAMATTMVPSTMAFADTTAPVEGTQEPTYITEAPASIYEVDYETHVQNIGWQEAVKTVGDKADLEDVKMAGTEGQGLRLEAIKISGANLPEGASITYKAHSQNKGWMDAKTTEAGTTVDKADYAGTEGQGLRLEALKLTLNGMPGYALKVRVHVQNKGWMDAVTVDNGTDLDEASIVGTEGQGLRLEGIKIQIVKTDDEKAAEVAAINAVAKAEATKNEEDIKAAKEAVAAVNDATVKAEQTAKVDAIIGENPDQPEVTELEVTSVNDITTTYVTVGIKEATEDLTAKTIVIKDSEGKEIAVKPVDIKKGAKTVEFDFETAVSKDALKGVWTIGDLSYDFDEKAKIKDFMNANTQLKLKAALEALGIENINEDNYPLYLEAKDDMDIAEEELKVEDIQALIDKVNADNLTATEKAAIVKSVYDAVKVGNDVKLKDALANSAFIKVNNDWITSYKTFLHAKFISNQVTGEFVDPATVSIEDIQDSIYDANDDAIQNNPNYNGVANIVDKDKLNSLKDLITAYAKVDKDGAYVTSGYDSKISDINVQLAVADVLEATTPTSFGNKVKALAELVKDSGTPIANYNEALNKEYVQDVQANKAGITSVSDLNRIISATNDDNADKLIDNVIAANTADKLFDALTKLEIKNVGATNKDAYGNKISGISGFSQVPKLDSQGNRDNDTAKKKIQEIVDKTNLEELSNATKDNIISKLTVFGIDNFIASNAEKYADKNNSVVVAYSSTGLADLLSNPSASLQVFTKSSSNTISYSVDTVNTTVDGTTTDVITNKIKSAIDLSNKTIAELKEISKIATATTATEVDEALKALYDVNFANMTQYGNVATADKLYIAQQLLNKKGSSATLEEAGQVTASTNFSTLYGLLWNSGGTLGIINEYNNKLNVVINHIAASDVASDVATKLKGINAKFDALTPSKKSEVAQDFLNACTFDETSQALKNSFKSLAEVSKLLDSVM